MALSSLTIHVPLCELLSMKVIMIRRSDGYSMHRVN